MAVWPLTSSLSVEQDFRARGFTSLCDAPDKKSLLGIIFSTITEFFMRMPLTNKNNSKNVEWKFFMNFRETVQNYCLKNLILFFSRPNVVLQLYFFFHKQMQIL